MIKNVFHSVFGVAIVSLWCVVVTATLGVILTSVMTNIITWQ